MLNNLDARLDEIGALGDCDVHYRYMNAYTISVVVRVARATPTSFWTNHLLAFKSNGIAKLLQLLQPHSRTRTYAHTYTSAQRATHLKSVLARVYSVSRHNLNTTTVP
jgi:hypothetical protein